MTLLTVTSLTTLMITQIGQSCCSQKSHFNHVSKCHEPVILVNLLFKIHSFGKTITSSRAARFTNPSVFVFNNLVFVDSNGAPRFAMFAVDVNTFIISNLLPYKRKDAFLRIFPISFPCCFTRRVY